MHDGLAQSVRRQRPAAKSSACRAASKACASPPASCRRGRSRTSTSSSATSNISSTSQPTTEADFILFPELFTLQLLSFEEKELSPARGDREAVDLHADDPRGAERHGAEIQHQHHRRIASDARRRRRHPERRLRLPARRHRSTSRRRSTRRPTSAIGGTSRAATRSTRSRPTAGRSACSSATTANFPNWPAGWSTRARGSSSCRSAPTAARAIMRVRYCCQARAIENQCFVVLCRQCRQPAQRRTTWTSSMRRAAS